MIEVNTEVPVCAADLGIQLNRLPARRDRFIQLALPVEGDTEVVV